MPRAPGQQITRAVASHRHQKIAAEGEGVVVHFNYRAVKKERIPDELRHQIMAMEHSTE